MAIIATIIFLWLLFVLVAHLRAYKLEKKVKKLRELIHHQRNLAARMCEVTAQMEAAQQCLDDPDVPDRQSVFRLGRELQELEEEHYKVVLDLHRAGVWHYLVPRGER